MRAVLDAIEPNVSPIAANTIVTGALKRLGYAQPRDAPMAALGPLLMAEVARGLRTHRVPERQITECSTRLLAMQKANAAAYHVPQHDDPATSSQMRPGVDAPHYVPIECEDDVVKARNEARELARRVGFSSIDQVKIATVVSELARNIISYAGHGLLKVLCS